MSELAALKATAGNSSPVSSWPAGKQAGGLASWKCKMLIKLAKSVREFLENRVVVEHADGRVEIVISEDDWHGLLGVLRHIQYGSTLAPEVIDNAIAAIERNAKPLQDKENG